MRNRDEILAKKIKCFSYGKSNYVCRNCKFKFFLCYIRKDWPHCVNIQVNKTVKILKSDKGESKI